MKNTILAVSLLFFSTKAVSQPTVVDHELRIPRISFFTPPKQKFITDISGLSRELFPNKMRSAIAPFGGVKLTPFLELDLDLLIIVTNSYVGNADEIVREFQTNGDDLALVLRRAMEHGSMSTSDVLGVNAGAQILSRLKLELGVTSVKMSYWSNGLQSDFSDRQMQAEDEARATIFDFIHNQKAKRLVFISAFIQSDSTTNMKVGFPELVKHYIPSGGLDWVYLSADGLGHFSQHPNSGLKMADNELISFLSLNGAIILDYPTMDNYHTDQFYGGIHFMQGRKDLEEIGLNRIASFPVESYGIFGYCAQSGDEVRVYQVSPEVSVFQSSLVLRPARIGPIHRFVLSH